jgi:hypothetical protein
VQTPTPENDLLARRPRPTAARRAVASRQPERDRWLADFEEPETLRQLACAMVLRLQVEIDVQLREPQIPAMGVKERWSFHHDADIQAEKGVRQQRLLIRGDWQLPWVLNVSNGGKPVLANLPPYVRHVP